jgi:hypothetical protein
MVDFSNKYLAEIERFLGAAIEHSEVLTTDEIDPREIIYQIAEQTGQNWYSYGEGVRCVPNIVTISIPETKADKAEDFETIFNEHRFLELMDSYLADQNLRLFNPLRVEVQTVSKGNSRVMFGRAGLALDWPGPDLGAELVLVKLDSRSRQIVGVEPPRPQIPQLARLTALNAEVYQNRYLITKPSIYVGRLRSVIDEETGRLLRRNDFVFAHQEIPDATPNSVSRQHATIEFRAGTFYLLDHGSANGTAIQRERLKQRLPVTSAHTNGVALEDGDILRFGSARVTFEIVLPENVDLSFHFELPLPINPLPDLPKDTGQMEKLDRTQQDHSRFNTPPRRQK